ncbi:MAG: hypothetical protein ABR530_06520 [Pyrinomonadaceae bacterium]
MQVEIHIRGLAICYEKGLRFQSTFVCDASHPLVLSYPGGQPVPLHVDGSDREMTFSASGLPADGGRLPGNGYEKIFNMAGAYAHGPGMLVEKRSGKTDVVVMKLSNARVGTYKATDRDYYVQNADHIGAPARIIPPVAKVIMATFDVTGDLTMNVRGLSGVSRDFAITFPYQDGGSLLLDFNNDCDSASAHNDFVHYYDIVADRAGMRFVAGQVRGSYADDIIRDSQRMTGTVFSPEHGNCDPVIVDPPPPPPPPDPPIGP